MSYRKLEIWQLAKDLVIDIHNMTMQLPGFELYEQGQQIRRPVNPLSLTLLKVTAGGATNKNLSASSCMP